ncbi:MAG TPA: N-6 DNA methylase [Verrucomicrobiota bacterium]|nr:N-6 DNA methylase [Verrucomicrobiota bacterium]
MNLKSELQNYGVANVRLFGDSAKPELLDYLDLVESRRPAELLPDGVAESQDKPLLFFVNESRLSQPPAEQDKKCDELRRKLACRGDRAFLARIRPGELAVIPVSLDDKTPEWVRYTPGTPEALTFFSRLAHGHYDGQGEPKEADYVFTAMFKLVWSVADRLAALNLKRTDVLSLMGRALFFRFLRDREVVREDDCHKIAPKAKSIFDCFANAENAARTSAWLDKTFNGDLLPLTDNGNTSYFEGIGQRTGGRVFIHLTAILKGEEPSGDSGWQTLLSFRPEERNWGAYDFAHVPVGLLSQVYERFAWKWEHDTAKETSVHYTPRNIAATLVDEAFIKLPNAHEARVLDPACGASVFLVLAFRRLYQELWKETKQRPTRRAIRKILDTQLTGFDISESAIRLASLSLYLTAIELDPKPVPLEDLRFNHLRGKVLFNFRREGVDPAEGAVAGSLGEHVGNRFDGQFDLILSNPPWTSLKSKDRPLAEQYNQLSKAIIKRRANEQTAAAYENPDFGPDLPFVWKATEWCKPGGRIAMALPARILLKQEDIPRRARETFLRWVEVTGIINGTNLSDTAVWPKMGQPFMLLFARNRQPKPGHTLRLITPQYDTSLNRKGEMQIDAKSVQSIEVEATFAQPWIWKTLALGTSLDAGVVERFQRAGCPRLEDYWEKQLGLLSVAGYMVKEGQTQRDASFLKRLPDFTSVADGEFVVNTTGLRTFGRNTACWPRSRDNYRAPLLLVKQAPGPQREKSWALISFEDVAFNQCFPGYSAAKHRDGEALVRYVQLFAHSYLRMHFALSTRPRFGAERRVLDKADFDDCPIFPFEKLTSEQRRLVAQLSQRLIARDLAVFDEIDTFFGSLFGLDARDMEVVRDTVEVAMPYIESRDRACTPPRPAERERFRKRLESILRPFFKVTGDEPYVELWKPDSAFLQTSAPFGLLLISKRGTTMPAPDGLFREVLLKLADDTGSTRIVQQIEGGLLVALLNQYRYWTPSRARLLGAELVREHLDVFDP